VNGFDVNVFFQMFMRDVKIRRQGNVVVNYERIGEVWNDAAPLQQRNPVLVGPVKGKSLVALRNEQVINFGVHLLSHELRLVLGLQPGSVIAYKNMTWGEHTHRSFKRV
jgi:hypothetical protein